MSKGKLLTTHPIKTSLRKENVQIKIDSHTGMFSADVDGKLLSDSDLSNLRQRIEFQVKYIDKDLWPLIVIKHEANGFWGNNEWGAESFFSCNIDLILATKKDSKGIFFYVQGSLVNHEVSLRGQIPYKLEREHWDDFNQENTVINYTPQRYAAVINLLNSIRDAVSEFTNVVENSDQTAANIEKKLDKQIKLLTEGDSPGHN